MTRQHQVQQATTALRLALRRMVGRYPYHAEWLSPDRWQGRAAIGTMAVSIKTGAPQFFYNAAFVCRCSDAQLEGVIHHELNHLVFRHPYLDPTQYSNRHALTIAEEVTVNEHVPEPLPSDPLTLDEFPELPAGEGTIARYHRLANRDDLADRVRMLDLHSLWDQGDAEPIAGLDMQSADQAMLAKLLRQRNRDAMRWALSGMGDHEGGCGVDNLDGSPIHNKPLDWTHILATVIGQRIRREATFHRPSRRMPDRVGVLPGMICRPDHPPVLAAIDTSSSMHRRHFERIRGELEQLRNIAQVIVVQCDKVIRSKYALRRPLQTIKGRGGTDLRPPLAAEILNRYRPGVVIYFTDGDGPVPKQAPCVPVVWCLTTDSKPPADWGRVIRLSGSTRM